MSIYNFVYYSTIPAQGGPVRLPVRSLGVGGRIREWRIIRARP